jgi:hypothetical protein
MKISLFLILSIFLSFTFIFINSVNAINLNNVTEGQGFIYNQTSSGSIMTGLRITAKFNETLTKVTINSSSSATKCYVYDSGYSIQLASASFVGNIATFNYNLTAGTSYRILVDNSGSNYNSVYLFPYASYPINKVNINFNYGSSQGTDWPTSYNIDNITTSIIDYLPISILSYPLNNLNTISNQTTNFQCNQTDDINLKNVTFYLWNSTNSIINTSSQNISGLSNSTNFSYNITTNGKYTWNCLVFDNNSQSSWDLNRTLNTNCIQNYLGAWSLNVSSCDMQVTNSTNLLYILNNGAKSNVYIYNLSHNPIINGTITNPSILTNNYLNVTLDTNGYINVQ